MLTGDEHAKEVMLEASESMVDRYSPSVSLRSELSLTCRPGASDPGTNFEPRTTRKSTP